MTWKELLAKRIERAYSIADGLIGMVDDSDLAWKPAAGANWMTTGQLLHHLTDACGMGMRGFATGDWGLPEGVDINNIPPEMMLPPAEKLPAVKSVAEAKALIARDKEVALETLAQAGEDRLCREQSCAPWNPGQIQSLGWWMLFMVDHLEKHASQLYYYLKLQGKPVGTGNLWGD